METIKIANQMMEKIDQLELLRTEVKEIGNQKADAIATYERELAKVIIRLRNHDAFELEGETIMNPPVSIIEKVARGVCWKEALSRDLAETKYKSVLKEVDIMLAQLNGLQSINRHLDTN